MSAIEGWYDDPSSGERMRYWDGTGWTERVQDKPVAASTGVSPPSGSETPIDPIPAPEQSDFAELDMSFGFTDDEIDPVAPAEVPDTVEEEPLPELRRETGKTSRAQRIENKAADKSTKSVRGKKSAPRAESSTWIVGLPIIVFLLIAPANPQMGATVIAGVAALTAAYTLITGRPSWARISKRWLALIPAALSVALFVGALFLPSSLVIAPKFLTAAPSPDETQAAALLIEWEQIDPRLTLEWSEELAMKRAVEVCHRDYASQTPDQQVKEVMKNFNFSSEPAISAAQSRAIVESVRGNFCGQPGERDAIVLSELSYSIPGLWAIAVDFITGKSIPSKMMSSPISLVGYPESAGGHT